MKCKILCPTLQIDGGEDFTSEYNNVVVSFASAGDIAEVYRRISMCEAQMLTEFGIEPLERESSAVLQSEFPLTLKRVSETEWSLSRR